MTNEEDIASVISPISIKKQRGGKIFSYIDKKEMNEMPHQTLNMPDSK